MTHAGAVGIGLARTGTRRDIPNTNDSLLLMPVLTRDDACEEFGMYICAPNVSKP